MGDHLEAAMRKAGAKSLGGDRYSVSIPNDPDGMVGRACPDGSCSPGYFKLKLREEATEENRPAFCPYCRNSAPLDDFFTSEQRRFAVDHVEQAATQALGAMIEGIFGGRKKRYGGDFLSIQMSVSTPPPRPIRRPMEEELRRSLDCPKCGMNHAVFGLAVWCPSCGADIFLTHVDSELAVVRAMLADAGRRRELLGSRIAAQDIENCLEDVVSIFEAVGRALLARHLRGKGMGKEDVEELLRKKVGNAFQSIKRAEEVCREHAGVELLDGVDANVSDALRATFEKRHPITHNLGVVDRKYLEKAMTAEREGRDVRVSGEEVSEAIRGTMVVLSGLHARLFSASGGPTGQ